MSATPATETLIAVENGVELGGLQTRRLSVEGTGVPFLFLHGFADSADTWVPLLRELGARGRAAAAIDLGGFGTAATLAPDRGLLEQWDAMVDQAVGELHADHHGDGVFVAGNSLGGCLSIRAAQRADLPVAGVVPIAPAGLDMARWFPVIESQRLIRLLELSPLPVPERIVREFVGRVYSSLAFSSPSRANAEAIESFTSHIATIARGNAILDIGRRLLPELTNPFQLELIDCPLLLVWGERDRMVYTTGAERVLRTVPYADIEIIPDCGHCPQVEVPAELARMLLDFPDAYEHP
jgi:pimeloyl-ACP methyl ester carboxylesterase